MNTASDITLEDNLKDPSSLFYFVKSLNEFRNKYDELTLPYMDLSETNRVVRISRGNLELIINLSNNDISIDKEVLLRTGEGRSLKSLQAIIVKK